MKGSQRSDRGRNWVLGAIIVTVDDLELTARVRAVVESGPAADSLNVTQPSPGEVVVQAHPSSNYVVVLTPGLRRQVEAALREWIPQLTSVRFDPHH
ncbi:MAG TPA: hypothetical protein VNF75_00395 [Candidatus Dormibacteraeota bacterium]|nr:hypothetical protein [Candidatus Dormibacteraeota bacterium]